MVLKTATPASAAARTGALNCQWLTDTTDIKAALPEHQARILARREATVRLRRQRLVEHLHRLGPAPLGHFLHEVEVSTGADVTARLERYAEIDLEFVRALGGDKFAPIVRVIDGGSE